MDDLIKESFYNRVLELFQNAKRKVSAAVNMTMVYSYYEAGRMIVEEEQQGKERAEYGKYILKQLSEKLTKELGRGFSYDNLKLMRKFYTVYEAKHCVAKETIKACFKKLLKQSGVFSDHEIELLLL